MRQPRKKPTKADSPYRCKDCALAVDRQCAALDGHLILCRCPHSKGGEFLHFLSDKICEHFEKGQEL